MKKPIIYSKMTREQKALYNAAKYVFEGSEALHYINCVQLAYQRDTFLERHVCQVKLQDQHMILKGFWNGTAFKTTFVTEKVLNANTPSGIDWTPIAIQMAKHLYRVGKEFKEIFVFINFEYDTEPYCTVAYAPNIWEGKKEQTETIFYYPPEIATMR